MNIIHSHIYIYRLNIIIIIITMRERIYDSKINLTD